MIVVYQICCGVDVHKSFLVATMIKTTSGVQLVYLKKRFSTFDNSILEFKQWLLEHQCFDLCLESTGKYWVPVFNLLEDDLFRLGLVPGSYIPCRDIRILRDFTRYCYKLVSCRSSERNRYQNALTVCNVALDSVVSDIFGKSAASVLDYLFEQSDNSIIQEDYSRFFRSLKKKSDSILESVEGYQMTDSQKVRMRLIRAHMDYITSAINDIDTKFDELTAPYENAIHLLCTIPGIKWDSAITILSEIGDDMTPFPSSKLYAPGPD